MTTWVGSPRRYYLLKVQQFEQQCEPALASAFLSKFEATTGEALPEWVPHQTALEAARYTTLEDLRGADTDELMCQAGLTRTEAAAVLSAVYRGGASSAPTLTINAALPAGDSSSSPPLTINATGQAA